MATKRSKQFATLLALGCIAGSCNVHFSSAHAATPSPLAGPEQLSLTAGTNLAAVAGELERQHNGVVSMITERTNALVNLHRLAAAAQKNVDRDLLVFANTRGTALVVFFTAITKHGDESADAPAQLDTLEAAVRAEAAAGAFVPAVATDKLQAAAKKLAVLAKQQSDAERLSAWVTFYKDTKARTETLHTAAGEVRAKANQVAEKSTSALLAPENN